MMIRFEERLQLESMTSWAVGENPDGGEMNAGRVTVEVEEGTPGQCFQKSLMEGLFEDLGLFGFH